MNDYNENYKATSQVDLSPKTMTILAHATKKKPTKIPPQIARR